MPLSRHLPAGNNNDYLTESHKIYEYIYYQKIFGRIALFVACSLIVFLFIQYTRHFFYQPEDKIALQQINMREQELWQAYVQHRISDAIYTRLTGNLDKEKQKIESKYPFPLFIWQLKPYRFPFVYPLLIIIIYGAGFYVWMKKAEPSLDAFFYQVSQREPPMSKPKQIVNLMYLVNTKNEKGKQLFLNTFKDFDKFVEYISSGTDGLFKPENVQKRFNAFRKLIQNDLPRLGIDAQEFLYFVLILFTHEEALRYGNIPTGLISTTIKDYTLKKMLSLYYRRHLPVLYDIKGEFIEKDYKAYVYLKIYYQYVKSLTIDTSAQGEGK